MKTMKWKNAACVILAASNSPAFVYKTIRNVTARTSGYDKDYEEKTDFQILALKKSSESPSVSESYVFPGGTANVADSSDEWIQLFSTFGYSVDTLCKRLNNFNTKLPIFTDENNSLPKCISLRITAIRETFEECGILLCKSAQTSTESTISIKSKHFNIKEIDTWRAKVLKNPKEFLNLCLHNNCYPDVTSLFIWNNWKTPSVIPFRFDAIYFIALMENIVEATPDRYEIQSLKWITAANLLAEYMDGTAKLDPPIFYEVSSLSRFNKIADLATFISNLDGMAFTQWFPVKVFTKDGQLTVLPGDDLYLDDTRRLTGVLVKEDVTTKSLECNQMHRIVLLDEKPKRMKIVRKNLPVKSFWYVLPGAHCDQLQSNL